MRHTTRRAAALAATAALALGAAACEVEGETSGDPAIEDPAAETGESGL